MFTSFNRLTWRAGLLTTVISLLAFTVALAASGGLDTTFGGDGLVTGYAVPSDPNRTETARGIALQPDRKIIAAGWSEVPPTLAEDFALIRYNPNGALDTTFSGDGRLTTNFGGQDYAYSVALQSDGRIIAAGSRCSNISNCDVALARYNPGGGLDTTFSLDGKQITGFGAGDNGSRGGLVIQPDGKIVVAGYMWNGANYDFAVYRYAANGSLDTTFSGDGRANIGFGTGRTDSATALAYQSSDGKIVVAGYTCVAAGAACNGGTLNFATVRLNPNGTMDTTFGNSGRVITDFAADEMALGLAGHRDGRIVVVGQKSTPSADFIAMARYKPNGSLDTTFNGTGKKVFRAGPGAGIWYSWATGVIVQPEDPNLQTDDKLVVLGTTSNYSSINDMVLVRLYNTGGFDTTFSGDGKAFIDFGGDDFGYGLVRQPWDGRYVLAGGTNNGIGGADFALARLLP